MSSYILGLPYWRQAIRTKLLAWLGGVNELVATNKVVKLGFLVVWRRQLAFTRERCYFRCVSESLPQPSYPGSVTPWNPFGVDQFGKAPEFVSKGNPQNGNSLLLDSLPTKKHPRNFELCPKRCAASCRRRRSKQVPPAPEHVAPAAGHPGRWRGRATHARGGFRVPVLC